MSLNIPKISCSTNANSYFRTAKVWVYVLGIQRPKQHPVISNDVDGHVPTEIAAGDVRGSLLRDTELRT